jgi:tetratricopeptide (TPR) repeat protein
MSMKARTATVVLAALAIMVVVGPTPLARSAKTEASVVDETTRVRGEVYALFMRALMAQRRGEYRSAASDVRKAVELQPDSPPVLIQGAELLERMGRLRDAEEMARRALELDPENIETLWFVADRAAARALGTSKPDAKSREEALKLYARLRELGVEDAELLRKVVSLRLQAGDQAGALEAARLLAEKRPGDRHAVGMLAQLLLDSGEPREALRVLVRFIAEHPNDSPLIRLAEELAQDLDAWDIVEEVFAGSDGFEERAVEAQRLRGQALLRLDQVESASRALEKVLLTDPTDRNVKYHLSRIYRRMGRLGEASVFARDLAEEAPGDRGANLLLAEILDDQGDVERALNAYNTVLRLFATEEIDSQALQVREAVRRRMFLLYLVNDQPGAARRLIERSEVPDAPETLQLLARLAVTQEEWAEARQLARRLRGDGEIATAAMIEAEIYLRTDRANRAKTKIEEAVQEAGSSARVRGAALYLDASLVDEGVALLREWVEQEPDSTDARFQLGSYLYQAERFEDAEVEMREVFRVDPEHSQALNFLGYSYAERGIHLAEALDLIQRALRIDAWNGAYLDSLGWAYYQMGRYEDAQEPLEQAARTYPHDPTVLEHLGDLYVKVGERELAVAAWNRAIQAGAEDVGALRAKIEVVEVAEQEGQPSGQTAEPAPAGDPFDPANPPPWP